jgi:hypothetical protein
MLTAEKALAAAVTALWTTPGVDDEPDVVAVRCFAGAPDPRWFADGDGDAACCWAESWEARIRPGSRQVRSVAVGKEDGAPDTVSRALGIADFVMTVRLRSSGKKARLSELALEFHRAFCTGVCFGEYQVTGPVRAVRLLDADTRMPAPELALRLPVRGPLATVSDEYAISTVKAALPGDESAVLPEPEPEEDDGTE